MARPKTKSKPRKPAPDAPVAKTLWDLGDGAQPPSDADVAAQDAPQRERVALALCLEAADTLTQRTRFLNADSRQQVAQRIADGINGTTKQFHLVIFRAEKPPEATADLFHRPSVEVDIL